ncbi:MAG TPA: hypothetical protein VGG74_37330 [Kofleriaceae bacterium]|jgi:hypothetical protein
MKLLLVVLLTSCVSNVDGDSDDADLVDTSGQTPFATVAGVNSDYCTVSPYNCRFREGDSRVDTKSGLDSWGIVDGAEIRDGNGDAMYPETGAARMTFNYGQKRTLAGTPHALALSTANSSAGWYPIDHIPGADSFDEQVGDVAAKGADLAEMACYEIRNADDEALAAHKVVKGATGTNERAGDYLPLVRANGRRSANLVFSVPGFALGGATTDHFPAGTKFRRFDVPTSSGLPSISIPLWNEKAPDDKIGTMRFLYGRIRAADGTERYGWMAQDALDVASGCP